MKILYVWLSLSNLKKIAYAYTVAILLLVALPINGEGQLFGKLNDNYVLEIRLDYLTHTLLFAPWVLVGGLGWKIYLMRPIGKGLSFLLAVAFAIFCEYLQLLLPHRTFNINDLIANSIGVVLGCILLWSCVFYLKVYL